MFARSALTLRPLLAQRAAGAKNIHLDLALGNVEQARDFAVAQFFLLAQQQNRALVYRAATGASPRASSIARPAPAPLPGSASPGARGRGIRWTSLSRGVSFAQLVERQITGDAEEPETRFFRWQPLRAEAIELQKAVLREGPAPLLRSPSMHSRNRQSFGYSSLKSAANFSWLGVITALTKTGERQESYKESMREMIRRNRCRRGSHTRCRQQRELDEFED